MPDKLDHQLIEEQAALFALGALPDEAANQFRQRLATGCPLCQAAFTRCQQIVGLLPFSAPPQNLRTQLMEKVGATTTLSMRPRFETSTLVRASDSPWEDAPTAGVQVRPLLVENTMLVRMAPKTTYPAHHHPLGEQCLVLEGSIETAGIAARAGDFKYMPAGSSHAPLYTEDGCVLLTYA